jgi:glycosyltransferase involved in cell wall biosynthesis
MIKLSEHPDLKDIEWHVWGAGGDFPVTLFDGCKNLYFHGAFSSVEDHKAVVHSLDAFTLFSTFFEGLPVSLMEAMGAGLPWIATDRGGISGLAVDPKFTILLSANPSDDECAEACRTLADRLGVSRNPCNHVIEFYQNHLSESSLTLQWEALLAGESVVR